MSTLPGAPIPATSTFALVTTTATTNTISAPTTATTKRTWTSHYRNQSRTSPKAGMELRMKNQSVLAKGAENLNEGRQLLSTQNLGANIIKGGRQTREETSNAHRLTLFLHRIYISKNDWDISCSSVLTIHWKESLMKIIGMPQIINPRIHLLSSFPHKFGLV